MTARPRDPTDPFFTVLPLLSVALFIFNNFWLKQAFPGLVSGKLSDVCACFFLPLYLGVLLSKLVSGGASLRVGYGAAVTVSLMVTVKATAGGSALLNRLVASASGLFDLHFAPNQADASDLVALPFALFAVLYARHVELRARVSRASSDAPTASLARGTP
jgi:hypothetical protein